MIDWVAMARCFSWLAGASALAGALAWPVAVTAASDEPVSKASVEDLVELLSQRLPDRSFIRTRLPDARTNLCAGQGGAVAAGGASNGAIGAGGPGAGAGSRARSLEVVPYAGDATPGVHLDVRFATGSDRLASEDVALLDNLAGALTDPRLQDARFSIAGHTDATGPAQLNLELSCARALAVARHLQGRGIGAERMSAYGFGSQRPLTLERRAAAFNRRVEIRLAP